MVLKVAIAALIGSIAAQQLAPDQDPTPGLYDGDSSELLPETYPVPELIEEGEGPNIYPPPEVFDEGEESNIYPPPTIEPVST